MKNTLVLLGALLIFMALLVGCDTEQVTGPDIPENQDVLVLHFGVTNDMDYVPFAAATIPMVTGGSGVYSYELYQDDQFIGHDPIQILRFTEVRDYEITLKVWDAETDSVRTASVMVSGMQAPLGMPLEATLYTADFAGYVPFTASVLGIARGGVPPYSYEIIVDGVTLYEDDTALIYITEPENHEVVFRVTDSVGDVAQSANNILGLEPEEEPLMRINFVALPQVVEQGKYTGLITLVYGGQPPFDFEIKVDGQTVSWEPTYMYQVNFLGEKIAMVKVTDATGMSSEIGLSIFGVDSDIYIPQTTMDVTASPYEAQQGEDIAFHADVRGDYDLIEWYIIGNDDIIGYGDDITRNFQQLGFEYVEARAYWLGDLAVSDTTRVTITPADDPVGPTVDLTSDNYMDYAPFYFTLHADIDVGDAPIVSIEWYVRTDDGTWFGPIPNENSVDYQGIMDAVGEQPYSVTVTDANGMISMDGVIISGINPEEEELTVDVTGGPQGLLEPVMVTLEAYASGGDGNYSYSWYSPTDGSIVSTERFPIIEGLMSGRHTFICDVTDGVGQTASDQVVITVLEDLGPEVVPWSFCPNLWVGPSDSFASTTATVDVPGNYNSFIQFEWDTRQTDPGDCVAEIILPNGHRLVWELYDIYNDRPAVIYYELGDIWLEGEITLNLYWRGTGKSLLKCDGWNKWQLIAGNAIIPVNKSTETLVVHLDDPNRDTYIKRQ